ncbi:MAG TPA: hypothetical protein VFB66_20830 [Tepidisphaeraceae bacterium]|nr:hypothetical protein [Tepidisphaeraceae bacterium]
MGLLRATRPIAILASFTLLLTGCSTNEGPKPYVFEGSVSSLTATVEAIDHDTRQVTLKGESGNSVTFAVHPRVKNLERVNVGDEVKAAYVETVEIEVRDAGKNAETAADAGDWETASDGSFSRQSTLTAVVDRVDKKKGTVVLRGPAGKARPFKVRDRRNLENVKIGDQVIATRSEALAVAVDPVDR